MLKSVICIRVIVEASRDSLTEAGGETDERSDQHLN